jgi:hypothetical protein
LRSVVEPFSWTCPFCNRPVTITEEDVCSDEAVLDIDNAEGNRILTCDYIVCPNPKCKRFSLTVRLGEAANTSPRNTGRWYDAKPLKTWQLIPQSKARPFPDYISKAILDDYNEACLIVDLSPKASAALARRCLQGIIRDFWGVKPAKLANEIEQIKGKVDSVTWQAIDAVRSVGNIGAHMEEDVNLIIDVEPNEAEKLIGLIEILLKEWYVAREERKSRVEAVIELAKGKEAARKTKTTRKSTRA